MIRRPCFPSIGSGKTRKTYLARVRGDFGLKLPAGSRQEGSPNTAESGTDAPLSSGGVISPDEGGSAASTATGADSEPLPASESSAGGELLRARDKPDELWWRYEPSRKDLFQDPTRRDNDIVTAKNTDEGAVEDSTAGTSTVGGEGFPQRGGSNEGVGGVAIRVNCPIRVMDPKDGVYGCHPDGKEAQTVSALQGCGGWVGVFRLGITRGRLRVPQTSCIATV